MITRIVYPPLKDSFFNAIAVSTEEIVLVTPYIQLGPTKMIIDILKRTDRLGKVKVLLVTNVNTSSFLSNSSDINAVLMFMQCIPNIQLFGIGNLHAKIYIFDSKRAIITSGNLSLNGMFNNLEIGVEVIDVFQATELRHRVNKFCEEGTEYKINSLIDIKKTLENHATEHASMLEHLHTQNSILNREIKKTVSKSVKIKTSTVIDPKITELISVSGTREIVHDKDEVVQKPNESSGTSIERKILDSPTKYPKWDEMYQNLLTYRKMHPNYWPVKGELFSDVELGNWCERQRFLNAKKRLERELFDKLTAINFQFNSAKNVWNYCIKLLSDYRYEFPEQWPNTKEIYNGQPLGKWCLIIRRYKQRGTLSKSRIAALNELGFVWDDFEAYWPASINLLKEFRVENPNKWPAKDESFRDYQMFAWCMNISKNRSKLNSVKLQELDVLGFPYNTFYEDNKLQLAKSSPKKKSSKVKFRPISPAIDQQKKAFS